MNIVCLAKSLGDQPIEGVFPLAFGQALSTYVTSNAPGLTLVLPPHSQAVPSSLPLARRLLTLEAGGDKFAVFEGKQGKNDYVFLRNENDTSADPRNFVDAAASYLAHKNVALDGALAIGTWPTNWTQKIIARQTRTLTCLPLAVDGDVFDPRTDALLPKRYSHQTPGPSGVWIRAAKNECKSTLQFKHGLPVRDVPCVAISTSACVHLHETHPALFEQHIGRVLRQEAQVVVIGGADNAELGELEQRFETWRKTYSDRFAVLPSSAQHLALGACDAWVFAGPPEAVHAHVAMKYGVLPIVVSQDATALSTLVSIDPQLTSGEAYVARPSAWDDACLQAIADTHRIEAFSLLRQRVMQVDRSWSNIVKSTFGSMREAAAALSVTNATA